MVFFGGGEGGNELLPYVDFDMIAAHPKIALSYSDGTTLLQAIHAKTGQVTYYGQTPGDWADLRHYTYTQFAAHFHQDCPAEMAHNSPWRTLHPGVCEGTLTGGYLGLTARMLGGPYFAYDPTQRYILFLEDHQRFSEVAAVSAYLSHIEQHPFMESVAGVLFGHYAADEQPQLWERLARLGRAHGIPVVYCDDFGHGVNHGILPIGVPAQLDADAHVLRFL